jgi:hypothetical protein
MRSGAVGMKGAGAACQFGDELVILAVELVVLAMSGARICPLKSDPRDVRSARGEAAS